MYRIPFKNIARESGLSTRTLYRVMNNDSGVTDGTRRRALRALNKFGYTSLSQRRGRSILIDVEPQDLFKQPLALALVKTISPECRVTFADSVIDRGNFLDDAADGTIRAHDILAGGPYEVNYLSYYREVPPEAKNRVFNSSFELGLKDWFPMVQRLRADDPDIPEPAAVFAAAEVAGAPHGGRVLQVRRNGKGSRMLLNSLPLKIRDGRDYTLSFYARASRDTELSVNSRKVKLSADWKRHTVALPGIKCYETWNHKKFPNRFRLMLDQRGDEDLELDAFQLEEGPPTPYRGFGAVEAAARPLALYGLFGPGEKPRFEVTVFNDAAEKREATVKWQLKDYRRAPVAEGETKLALEPGTGQSFSVEAPAGRRHYTLSLRLAAPGQTEQTAVVSASAVKDLAGLPGNHFFGACPIEGDNPPNLHDILELNRRLGFSFQVNYHTAYQSRAPKEWRENVVRFSRASGLEVLLSNYHPFPAGTRRDPDGGEYVTPENLRDVEEYHRELAARFKGKVACFETFAEYLKTPLETRAAADRHETPHSSPELLWANDALQLLFVMSGDLTNASSGNLLELAVSDTKGGPRFSVTNTERSDRPDLSKLRATVRREGGDTCYELAIPWEFLKPGFKPDNSLLPGFNLAISDNDGG